MGDTTCIHKDMLVNVSHGISLGTCESCGQIRRYDNHGNNPPEITKLGRINGVVVLPRAVEKLDLLTEELNEIGDRRRPAAAEVKPMPTAKPTARLKVKPEPVAEQPEAAAEPPAEPKAAQEPVIEAPAEPVAPKPKSKVSCKGCEFYRMDGAEIYCTSRRCPRRHPVLMRPEYRVEVRSEPVKNVPPVKRSIHSDEFYEDHKEEIIKDYYSSMTIVEVFRKWHISTPRWGLLKKQWQIKPKGKRNRYTSGVAKAALEYPDLATPETSPQLPVFPDFDKTWPFTVQEKWLEVYLELRKLEMTRSKTEMTRSKTV